jgi:hypothetical protein
MSVLFNLTVAASDGSTSFWAARAASTQNSLISRFKKLSKRKGFVLRRLRRLGRFMGKVALSSTKLSVPIKENGFPDFSGALHPEKGTVYIRYTGSRRNDFRAANRKRGKQPTPPGYTWHHHEVVGIMQLVKTSVHRGKNHIGGIFYWEMAFNKRYKR